MKSRIIAQLGETEILLPSLIAEGLLGNDRVKARLSILQAAARHASDPRAVRFDLADDCRALGIDAVAMERLVNGSNLTPGARVTASGLGDLGTAIWDDVAIMIRAVKAGDPATGEAALHRLAAIRADVSLGASDSLDMSQIAKLTAVSDVSGDSLHRLIMDLHKALNRLSAAHAQEIVAGAHVSGLLPADRPAIEAFMRGIDATRRLKFDHPGLATTATRAGARLTIQNDIGESDAHVVVISVQSDIVAVTYTDVHLARAKFFTGLFKDFPVQWSGLDRKSAAGLGDGGIFYLVTGRLPFAAQEQRDRFLEALGAALVFLIDWNKARKILRTWISNGEAVRVLEWAARNRFGHRAFLQLGGSDLVASAVHHAAPARIGFGERLDRALGQKAAVDFLKTVLRVCAESLQDGSSIRLTRDRIEADLLRNLERVDAALLTIIIRQAGLAREIAAGLGQCIRRQQQRAPVARAVFVAQARRIEQKADRIALEARGQIARLDAERTIEQLVDSIEQVIDEFEQAAFISSLVPNDVAPALLQPLAELCSAAVAGVEAAASGAAAAADVSEGYRIDSEDALAAIGRLAKAEHDADAAERALTAAVLQGDFDLKTALSVLDLARSVERATDRLAVFGHLLRQHVLADLAA